MGVENSITRLVLIFLQPDTAYLSLELIGLENLPSTYFFVHVAISLLLTGKP